MRCPHFLVPLFTLGLIAPSATAQPADNPIHHNLPRGPYAAGFRSVYQLDIARSYDPDYPVRGTPSSKKPRPVFIAIWYPAPAQTSAPMVYRDYLKAVSIDSPAPEFAKRLRAFTRDAMCNTAMRKEFSELTARERAAWDRFLASPTLGWQEAPAAPGKFPVILYHPGLGGTFEDNSVLFENLASHGYVVISSAYEMADASALNINGDQYTSFADLNFLTRYAATLPFADASRLGAVGQSYGAQAVLLWRSQPGSAIDAVVMLDSTVEYNGVDTPARATFKTLLSLNRNSTAPVFLAADRTRKPDFRTFDAYLAYAPRYEFTVDRQEHDDFISEGAIGQSLLASVSGNNAAASSAWSQYELVSVRVVQFLDAFVKRDSAALALLNNSGASLRAPKPLPPSGRQLAAIFYRDGPEKTRQLLAPVPTLDSGMFEDALSTLADDGHKQSLLPLVEIGVELLPKSANLQMLLGQALQLTGDKVKATAACNKALQLVAADADLDPQQKSELKSRATELLRALSK